jgi:hypothetical protein
MAKLEPHPVQPKSVDQARWRDVGYYYDDVSDTLTIYFWLFEVLCARGARVARGSDEHR